MSPVITQTSKKISRETLWQLLGLLAVAMLIVFGTMASDKQLDKFMPEAKIFPSVKNHKPSGMSAFYELCERAFPKRKVGEWDYAYRYLKGKNRRGNLPDDDLNIAANGVLIIVSPEESLAAFEVDDIVDWVKQGNSLVYLDNFQFRSSKRLLEKVGISATELDNPLNNVVSDGHFDKPLYSHLRTLNLSTSQKLGGGESLVTLRDQPVIVQKTVGKGKILIGACPLMVSNMQVKQTERWSNFQFLSNWLSTTGGAQILFDEKCHGSTKGTSVFFYFLHGPTGMVIGQILLLLLFGIIASYQRFGATRIVRNDRHISNLEHIDGLANTYFRAEARAAVLAIIWSGVKLKLCKALQINPHDSDEKLRNLEAKDIAILVEKCQSGIERKDLTDEDLKELVAACDKISERADDLMTSGRT